MLKVSYDTTHYIKYRDRNTLILTYLLFDTCLYYYENTNIIINYYYKVLTTKLFLSNETKCLNTILNIKTLFYYYDGNDYEIN